MLARKMTAIGVCGLFLMLGGCGGGDGGHGDDGAVGQSSGSTRGSTGNSASSSTSSSTSSTNSTSGTSNGGTSNDGTTQSGARAEGEQFPTELSASHILITHKDSTWHPPGVTRSRSEAEDLARRIAVLTRERGADFAELARKYSEDPAAQDTGGYLGIFQRGDMVIAFEVAVNSMKVGQTGVVVETEYGFHVVKRHPIRRVHAHHILIAWRGATNVSGGVDRSKETARQLAEEVRSIALTKDINLCDLAQKWSDDPNNKASCGDLGVVEPGYLAPIFEKALFKLRQGQISKVVESSYGFHIIWRE